MTKAEFEERKMWDESLMTEEEREAHLQRVHSFCGKIDDDTFIIHSDAVPTVSNDVYYDEEDFVRTINELCGSISDETFRLYPEEAV